MSVAKLNGPASEKPNRKSLYRRAEVRTVDSTQPEIELQPKSESKQTVSESNRAELVIPAASVGGVAATAVVSTNGSSERKVAANRKNAEKSTGPKTALGKTMSSRNSTRHGLLATTLPRLHGRSQKQFNRLLHSLTEDLEPLGAIEELLVEKIAQEYWRLRVASWYEAEEFARKSPYWSSGIEVILRYQTTINRQLFQAMNQLERVQRLRKGENVPAPLTVQVSQDGSPNSEVQNYEDKFPPANLSFRGALPSDGRQSDQKTGTDMRS
jgi:hypothetical protein